MPAKKPAKKAATKPALSKATAPKHPPSLAAQLEEIRDKLHAIVESRQELCEFLDRELQSLRRDFDLEGVVKVWPPAGQLHSDRSSTTVDGEG